ncbi:DUF4389 domain-containing protein [Candidatus Saccharibacteria bacterium]|nr:DUF4389 domain-containing protein [Candidatus Saccharibacteria bacterium]
MAKEVYPATLTIDYPKRLDRLTSFFRIITVIPIAIVLMVLIGAYGDSHVNEAGQRVAANTGGITVGLAAATALMIIFRQRYPRWWFDFALELNRFTTRVSAYLLLLTDTYPSTTDEQSVHMDLRYPDAERDLNRWLPLVKWFLAIPHYFVLLVLSIAAFLAVIIAWFAILFTGHYPKSLFDFVVGVMRWDWRVTAYAFLLATDEYPPFSLK